MRQPIVSFTPTEQRDIQAVSDAVAFARRWARDWATWCISLEFILNENGLAVQPPGPGR